jgi:HEPN superfamily Toprim-like protein
MGSYTELSVAGYPLVTSKSMVIPQAMTIFRETDKRTFARKISDRNPKVWEKPDSPEVDEAEIAIQYACSTCKVIDRLNVMGFNLRRVRQEFESLRRLEIGQLASWEDDSGTISEDMKFLEGLAFEEYAEGLRQVIARGLLPWPLYEPNGDSPVVKYILSDNDDRVLGFFGSDVRSLLRLACEVVNPESEVVQDITEIVSEQDETVCSNAIRALTSHYPEDSPRIVLVEGSTDAAILREALDLLYPHLSDYYTFFDFESSRSQGGTGHLVSIVKAFAAAGVSNRIVAIFDNDTAAREARRTLDALSLPPNIAVLHYPALERLRSYPTIGPTGPMPFDINGLAASIELYLGEDVLSENGAVTPVQWKGFSESLGAYQGEVMHKAQLQSAFWRKAQRCRTNPAAMRSGDWSGLEAILKSIFTAFDSIEADHGSRKAHLTG